jgi:hypothetical protein
MPRLTNIELEWKNDVMSDYSHASNMYVYHIISSFTIQHNGKNNP